MKNRNKRLPLLLIVAGIVLGGITISVGRLFFTTRYYESPRKAFYKDYSYSAAVGPIEIAADIGIYFVDADSAVYLARTSDNGLLMALMRVKDQKYAFQNYYAEADLYNLDEEAAFAALDGTKWLLFSSKAAAEARDDVRSVQEYVLDSDLRFCLALPKE